jgi:tRNA(Ile)-lysidine synthase TilS/MesJ
MSLCGKHLINDTWSGDECPLCVRGERDRLRDELSEWNDAAKTAQDEVCTAGEVHCTCVPLLRSEIKRLREMIPQAWDAGAEYEEDQSCSIRNRVGVPAKEDWMKQKGLA